VPVLPVRKDVKDQKDANDTACCHEREVLYVLQVVYVLFEAPGLTILRPEK
jgi:hypothetical protein